MKARTAQGAGASRFLIGQTACMTDDNTRLAVLIDADNTSAKLIKEMLEELAGYGTLTVKRAYGDWTNPHLNS
jgi:hypothetical protein